ncbi:DET1- and DDB1-associated protein 1 [Eurosta solidaginis]|uniref:DET1- and DDB1-associated protein 1 n=1 Tax=Eurosta solidaginis TaxID=178769 RepID=UPI00353095B7
MSVADFLKDLPSHNAQNFSQFNMEQGIRTSQKRPSVYLQTEDVASEQHIVMDKRCVLLRYLKQQWDKKSSTRKRENNSGEGSAGGNGTTNNCKKRPRLEPVEMN